MILSVDTRWEIREERRAALDVDQGYGARLFVQCPRCGLKPTETDR